MSSEIKFSINCINSIITKIKENYSTQSQLIILLLTGSFSPIRRDHIELCKLVKNWIEMNIEPKVNCIASILSPSHDRWTFSQREGKNCLAAELRIKLCKLAIDEAQVSDWIFVDSWDCEQVFAPTQAQVIQLQY
eukprot:TRINITY_DN5509_c0_g1_i2.p1 TRINITY_DN5509_c0_g1~~TRINITY_DN5509_c0_g1_i2.p1  ORF type:complete len:135 (-),score=46.90 TRINITY_DN5509_c0_g1_i2:491-895(-)